MVSKFTYRNQPVFYERTGRGEPLILLHGFGEDRKIWNNQLPVLALKNTVFTFDIPGSGESPFSGYASIKDLAECISLLADKENLDTFSVGGHSMGGYTAVEFATRFSERAKSLLMIHSSVFADDREKQAARKKGIAFIRQHGEKAFLRTTITGLFKNPEKHQDVIEELIQSNRSSAEALISYYEAMMQRRDCSDEIQKLVCPVLFIAGEHDKAVPLPTSLKQSHLPDESHFYILQESAHMGMIEQSEMVNEILAKFLEHTHLH